MTHSGGQPHNTGYRGQKYAVVVDVDNDGGPTVIGWMPTNTEDLAGLNTNPHWRNARFELVVDEHGGIAPSVVPRV